MRWLFAYLLTCLLAYACFVKKKSFRHVLLTFYTIMLIIALPPRSSTSLWSTIWYRERNELTKKYHSMKLVYIHSVIFIRVYARVSLYCVWVTVVHMLWFICLADCLIFVQWFENLSGILLKDTCLALCIIKSFNFKQIAQVLMCYYTV